MVQTGLLGSNGVESSPTTNRTQVFVSGQLRADESNSVVWCLQVPEGGLEPTENAVQHPVNADFGGGRATLRATDDPNLALLIQSWPYLNVRTRMAIRTLALAAANLPDAPECNPPISPASTPTTLERDQSASRDKAAAEVSGTGTGSQHADASATSGAGADASGDVR